MNIELNKIYCCDCIEFLKKLPDMYVDLVIADPPFNVKQDLVYYQDIDMNKEEYLKFLFDWMKEAKRIMKNSASLYVFSGSDYAAEIKILLTSSRYCDMKLRNWIIWTFDLGCHPKRHFKMRNNHIFFITKGDLYIFNGDAIRILSNPSDKRHNILGQIPSDSWDFPEPRKNSREYVGHPCQKPERLLERIILASSNKNDLILDPFIGSGTTAVVAKELGRNFIGCDISQKYVDLSNRRLEGINAETN